MKNRKSTLEKDYIPSVLNEVSYHVFEKRFDDLSNYELNVLYNYLQRHTDIFPLG